ncbi:STAS domain-containing protein [Nonomuraea pusilla]|uniref:STAS domain-containing protein n=1 Tax=Nonomuraea pusilla TaxID=46177 RepID=UPI003324A9DD
MIVICVGGEIDSTNSPELGTFVEQVRRPGEQIVFDLAEVSFIDSSGLHVLLDCARYCRSHGGELHLAAARGAPARLFEITGVASHLPVHDTAQHAIAAALAA